MSVSDEILAILKRLEGKIDKLAAAAPTVQEPPLKDELLDKEWANKTVKKELKRWGGEPMIGRLYSECPPEWHDAMASMLEWKAGKGREEVPVRLDRNGKPFHESDTFNARLSHAWARRLRAQPEQYNRHAKSQPTSPGNSAVDAPSFHEDAEPDDIDRFPF